MSRNYFKLGRQDNNSKDIKRLLTDEGIPYISLYPEQGADLIAFFSSLVFIEIKNPLASKKRKQGTEKEKWLFSICESRRIPYLFIETVDEMRSFINQRRSDSASLSEFMDLLDSLARIIP